MEVDISNDGNSYPFLYFSDCLGGLFVHHSHPTDFTACLFKTLNLTDRLSDIPCIGLGHRLDGDRRIPSDLDRADRNLACLSSLHRILSAYEEYLGLCPWVNEKRITLRTL